VSTFVITFYYGSETVIYYGSGSAKSGLLRQKVTVPVPQHCFFFFSSGRQR